MPHESMHPYQLSRRLVIWPTIGFAFALFRISSVLIIRYGLSNLLLSCPSHNVLPLAGACLCPLSLWPGHQPYRHRQINPKDQTKHPHIYNELNCFRKKSQFSLPLTIIINPTLRLNLNSKRITDSNPNFLCWRFLLGLPFLQYANELDCLC